MTFASKKITFLLFFFIIFTDQSNAKDQKKETLNGVNFVKVSNRIDTSGQPPKELLDKFSDKNYDLVINLAPPQSHGSVIEEGGLIAKHGTKYVNIPVDWDNPTEQDFDFFSSVLNANGQNRVLVHCQINMRGSLFTFLYRVIHEKIDPSLAHEKMNLVWVPSGKWLKFAHSILKKHQIDYTIF